MRALRSFSALLALALAPTSLLAAEQVKEEQTHLRMGISTALFVGASQQVVAAMMGPFRTLMQVQTGIDGEIVPTGDGLAIGDSIAEDKLQLAVMEGIEFAWVRQKHPDVKPLMAAVNEKPYTRSMLVVKADSPIKHFSDLKGKTVADYRFTRITSRLYVDRLSREAGEATARAYFGKYLHCDTAEELLDEVIDGKVDVALIEDVCLDHYQRRKPARCKGLRVLSQSAKFPASVVVYHAGRLHPATQKKLRDGMLDADKTLLGRQLMSFWQMTNFAKLPENYETLVTEIIKQYPSPSGDKKVASTRE